MVGGRLFHVLATATHVYDMNSPMPVVMLERRRSVLNLVATGRCVGETLLLVDAD